MEINIEMQRAFMLRWANMIDRCDNPKNKMYHRYGGRGIKVCQQWYDFFQFISDLPSDYFAKADLDRVNNNGNYEPENVRWATRAENCKNRENNRFIELDGKTKCISDWARGLEINVTTLMERLDNWSIKDALTLPKGTRLYNRWDRHVKSSERLAQLAKPKKQLKLYTYNGADYTMKDLSKMSGIPSKLLRKRINERKWPVNRAIETGVLNNHECAKIAAKASHNKDISCQKYARQ